MKFYNICYLDQRNAGDNNMFTRGGRRQVGGVNVHVEGDRGPFASVGGCRVGRLLAREDNVPPGRHLVMQSEVTRTRGLQSNFGFLTDL